MEDLLLRVLTLSAACSAALLPLLLLARRIRHRYAARTLYVLFLLLALRLVLPVQLSWSAPAVTVEVPSYSISAPVQRPAPVQNMTPTEQNQSGQTVQTPAQSLPQQVQTAPEAEPVIIRSTQLLSILWLAGAGAFLVFHCVSYLLARRRLLRSALSPTPEQADKCSTLRQALNIHRSVGLMRSSAVTSPMMLGLVRPVILLPDRDLTISELDLPLRHELLHLKRRDVAYKAVMLLANAVPGVVSGGVLAFARGLGEFGATAMIAGNIAGKTRTLPMAVYSEVAAGNMDSAFAYVAVIVAIAFLSILVMNAAAWRAGGGIHG